MTETPLQQLCALLGMDPESELDEIVLAAIDALKDAGQPRTIFAIGNNRICVSRVDSVAPSSDGRGKLALQLTKGAYVTLHDLDDPAEAARQLNALVDAQPGVRVVQYQPSSRPSRVQAIRR